MPKVRKISHGRIKQKTPKLPKHLAFIRTLPCLICQSMNSEAHHVIGYANRRGRAPKTDIKAVPLCSYHHRDGRFSVHSVGHQNFSEYNDGIDLMKIAIELANQSIEAGRI